jgi:galactonate dehydratase
VKITDVKAYTIWVGFRNQLLVKIETDEGIYGWGESGASSRELGVEGVIRHFREFLIGQDPMRRGRIWQEVYRSHYNEGGRVLQGALSAIDIALHDIAGKKLEVRVYDLLGGRQRDFVPLFATATPGRGEDMLRNAKLLRELGWDVIRFAWVDPDTTDDPDLFDPRAGIARTVDWLLKTRAALGHEVVLGIDWHHRLSIPETVSFCQQLPSDTLDFLEEPIRTQSPAAYEALRRMIDVPLAIGEELTDKWDFVPFVEGHLTDFARLDVCNIGGLTEAMKVAGWCEAHYIDVMPHNPLGPICTAASAHLAMAVPNMAWLEVFETIPDTVGMHYDREIFPLQPRIEPNRLHLADSPGLGIEVNEEALREAFRFSEAPHFRRSDGSVTNW